MAISKEAIPRGLNRHQALMGVLLMIFIGIVLLLREAEGASPNILLLLRSQISSLQEKCVIGLQGYQCNGQLITKTSSPSDNNSTSTMISRLEKLLIAGVGYSKSSHEVKLPVLKSPVATKLTNIENVKLFKTMNSAQEYFDLIYPNDGNVMYNGLYSHNSGVDMIFNNYFKGEMSIINSQSQYLSHQVNITDIEVTDDFQQIIDILPETLDRDIYKQIIQSFGDSVLTFIKYGGVVDSTKTIKSCYKDPKMMNYVNQHLDLILLGTDPGKVLPNSFMRYQNIHQLDMVGGNPQLDNIKARIETFKDNPVPIQFKGIPIWRVFPNGVKQNNMKIVYNEYMANQTTNAKSLAAALEKYRTQDKLNSLQFYAFTKTYPRYVYDQAAKFDLTTSQRRELDVNIKMNCYFPGRAVKEQHPNYYYYRPIISRNGEGNFDVQFKYGTCHKYNNQCTWASNRFDSFSAVMNFERSVGFTSPNKCVKVEFPNGLPIRCSAEILELHICAGCMPVFNDGRTSLSCECPFVK